MKRQCKAAKSKRTKRTARKLDRKKALELHARSFTPQEIANTQGVARTTVWRFLQQTKPERQALDQFKAQRADVLARLQAKSVDAQERIIGTLDDGVIGALTPSQKTGFLMALNATTGTSFDKERLERGESTQNHSIVSTMVDARVGSLYKRKPGVKPPKGTEEDQEPPQKG